MSIVKSTGVKIWLTSEVAISMHDWQFLNTANGSMLKIYLFWDTQKSQHLLIRIRKILTLSLFMTHEILLCCTKQTLEIIQQLMVTFKSLKSIIDFVTVKGESPINSFMTMSILKDFVDIQHKQSRHGVNDDVRFFQKNTKRCWLWNVWKFEKLFLGIFKFH